MRWSRSKRHAAAVAALVLLARGAGAASGAVEFSPPKAADGAIAVATFHPPKDFKPDSVSGKLDEIEVPFYLRADGAWDGVVGIPWGHKPGPARLHVIAKGEGKSMGFEGTLEVFDGKYPAEHLKVLNERHVKPTAKDLERIQREKTEIGRIYLDVTQKKYWSGAFALPIASAVTSVFGSKRLYNGQLQSAHLGLDLKAVVGTPIRAPEAGRVALAKALFMTGKTAIVDHGYGVFTIYAHLSRFRAKKGAILKKGDIIGWSGMTGRVSGPHLHWGAVVQRQRVNPQGLIEVLR